MGTPNDTDEFNVQPLPSLILTKKAAEELFKLLNSRPLQDGQSIVLVGDINRNINQALFVDAGILFWIG